MLTDIIVYAPQGFMPAAQELQKKRLSKYLILRTVVTGNKNIGTEEDPAWENIEEWEVGLGNGLNVQHSTMPNQMTPVVAYIRAEDKVIQEILAAGLTTMTVLAMCPAEGIAREIPPDPVTGEQRFEWVRVWKLLEEDPKAFAAYRTLVDWTEEERPARLPVLDLEGKPTGDTVPNPEREKIKRLGDWA